jgi:hypothetical protein
VRTWRDPDSLDSDSWAYRRYVYWMRAYQYDKWKEGKRPVKLTREDIVASAGFNLIGGILLLCIGVLLLVDACPG